MENIADTHDTDEEGQERTNTIQPDGEPSLVCKCEEVGRIHFVGE